MPNRKTHVWSSLGVSLVLGMINQRVQKAHDRPPFLLGATAGGAVGGMMPDVLEPATSPCHRKVCHAILPAFAVAIWAAKGWAAMLNALVAWAEEAPDPRDAGVNQTSFVRAGRFLVVGFAFGLAPGYGTHLVLDACTPKGLPLLGL